jgi:hypothetical protein
MANTRAQAATAQAIIMPIITRVPILVTPTAAPTIPTTMVTPAAAACLIRLLEPAAALMQAPSIEYPLAATHHSHRRRISSCSNSNSNNRVVAAMVATPRSLKV